MTKTIQNILDEWDEYKDKQIDFEIDRTENNDNYLNTIYYEQSEVDDMLKLLQKAINPTTKEVLDQLQKELSQYIQFYFDSNDISNSAKDILSIINDKFDEFSQSNHDNSKYACECKNCNPGGSYCRLKEV